MVEPKQNGDELEEKIDKRLALLRDSIELKLNKEVDLLLKSRFESTGKILGWAFGLVAVVFAGFGIKTIFDVREVARTTAVEEVKKKLAIDDPSSEFRRDIDKIVARGLIDSYLLSMAKSKGERFPSDLAISETDFRRLQSLLADPRTTEKDFSDALEVLLRSEDRGRNETLERLVQSLGSGVDEKYRWINEQPEKRAALFRLYTGDKLIQLSRKILVDETSTKMLLSSAVKYLASKDKQSGQLLERLANHKDEDVSMAAILALARVEPGSAAVKAILDKPKKTDNENDWATAVRVAIEVAKPMRFRIFDEDRNLDERQTLAAKALQSAIDRDFVFRLSSSISEHSAASLYISSKKNYSTLYGVSTDIILGSSSGAINELIRLGGPKSEALLKIIRAFCLEEDGRCWGVVRANLEAGGKILLQSGLEIDRAKAPGGVSLRPESTDRNSLILATWNDTEAVSKKGILAGVSNVSSMNFSVAVTKSLAAGDDER